MCRLFETIQVKNNMLRHIAYHNSRVNDTRLQLFGSDDHWDLSELITVPELDTHIIYRCRFVYSKEPEATEFSRYVPRTIEKLYLVDCGSLDYSYKYADRSSLEALKSRLTDPEIADVLLIKNGLITDTSFSNVAFYDGIHWVTPRTPLLKGTKRDYYIQTRQILPCDISVSDLAKYSKVRLLNAMLDLEEGDDIHIENLIYDNPVNK